MSSVNPALTPSVPSAVPIANAATFTLNGVSWQALTANVLYSLLANAEMYRFEVINGQNYQSMSYSDPAWVMRSEVYGPGFPFNQNMTFSFGLLVRSQNPQPFTNNWNIFGQIHCDNNVTGASPPFSFNVQPDVGGPTGEKLVFDINYQTPGGPVVYTNIGSVPFYRNQLHNYQVVFRDSQGASTGYTQVTIDGVVKATYNGPTGYASAVAQSYPKWGIYTGGSGSSSTATPAAGQDIVAFYYNVQYSSVVPAFYVSSSGSDANPGTITSPFLTIGHAISVMNTNSIKTTYVRSGTINETTIWQMGNGQSLLAYPGDPPFSMTVVNVVPSSGGVVSGVYGPGSDITVKGIQFSLGSGVEFNQVTNFVFQSNKFLGTASGANLTCNGPGSGLRIQGNQFNGNTYNPDGTPGDNNSYGVFPLNIVTGGGGDTSNYDDWIISDNTCNGGTFAFQIQNQNYTNPGTRTNIHVDRNTLVGWGDSRATLIGNEGISMVESYNPGNHSNTCSFNTLTPNTDVGTVWTQALEVSTAGMTFEGNICGAGVALARCPGTLWLNNQFTLAGGGTQVFTNDGPGTDSGTAGAAYDGVDIEIDTNLVNGTPVTGIGTNTGVQACIPAPSATGNTYYAPSAPYTG